LAGFIPDEKVAEVQHATDIVRLISEYVPLKRSGSRFKALCPFHDEKTPSFIVNPDRQIFKCFGCGEGGDVFSFVMKHLHVDFPEAVRMLAQKAGIEIVEKERGPSKGLKARVYDLNAWAAEFYCKHLKTDSGRAARDYLEKRGITPETADKFKLGLSPAGWNGLLREAQKRGISQDALVEAGLAVKKERGTGAYDRFRGRLMFPIFDIRGNALGFGARALDGSEVKYINSPETPGFNKGRTLYALNAAKEAISARRLAVIVEGYTDVLMAHQHGVNYVVAVLGTALGRDHVRMLRRYADRVVLVFDADTAGQRSSDRSLEIFLAEELEVRIATLPQGTDPCDYIVQHGAEAFEKQIEAAKDLITYKMDTTLPDKGDAAPKAVSDAIDQILTTISASRNPTLVELMLKQLAERSGVSEGALRMRISSLERRPGRGTRERSTVSKPRGEDRVEMAQREIVQGLLARSDLAAKLELESLLPAFTNPQYRAAAEHLAKLHGEFGALSEAEILARTPDEKLRELLSSLVGGDVSALEDGSEFDYEAQVRGAVALLKRFEIEKQVEEAKRRMLDAAGAGDESEQMRWLATYNEKKRELTRI